MITKIIIPPQLSRTRTCLSINQSHLYYTYPSSPPMHPRIHAYFPNHKSITQFTNHTYTHTKRTESFPIQFSDRWVEERSLLVSRNPKGVMNFCYYGLCQQRNYAEDENCYCIISLLSLIFAPSWLTVGKIITAITYIHHHTHVISCGLSASSFPHD